MLRHGAANPLSRPQRGKGKGKVEHLCLDSCTPRGLTRPQGGSPASLPLPGRRCSTWPRQYSLNLFAALSPQQPVPLPSAASLLPFTSCLPWEARAACDYSHFSPVTTSAGLSSIQSLLAQIFYLWLLFSWLLQNNVLWSPGLWN